MEKESSGSSRATKWLVAIGLLFGALILGGMFEALGLASWIVVVLAAAVVAYSFYRPEWSILGFSPSGVRKVFGVIGVLLLFGIAAGDTEEKRATEARDIVTLMKSRPEEGRKRLAEANDDLLHAIKLVDEGVEAAERSRRAKRDALSARAREARNAAKIASLEKQAEALPSYDLDGRMAILQADHRDGAIRSEMARQDGGPRGRGCEDAQGRGRGPAPAPVSRGVCPFRTQTLAEGWLRFGHDRLRHNPEQQPVRAQGLYASV